MGKLSLLAVFAHPDDESCGPGATLAMYAHRGVEVTLVCATRGELGAWGADQAVPLEEFGMIRVRELAGACECLGIRRWMVFGYPDGAVAQSNQQELEGQLVSWIRTVRPQVVIAHCPEGNKGHPDHNTLSRLTARAYIGAGRRDRFPGQLEQGLVPWKVLKLYYAIPPDPDVASRMWRIWHPFSSIDTTDFVDAKIRALHCHASQEECWRPVVEEIRRSPKWREAFYLARSRVLSPQFFEHDLFASVTGVEPTGR